MVNTNIKKGAWHGQEPLARLKSQNNFTKISFILFELRALRPSQMLLTVSGPFLDIKACVGSRVQKVQIFGRKAALMNLMRDLSIGQTTFIFIYESQILRQVGTKVAEIICFCCKSQILRQVRTKVAEIICFCFLSQILRQVCIKMVETIHFCYESQISRQSNTKVAEMLSFCNIRRS